MADHVGHAVHHFIGFEFGDAESISFNGETLPIYFVIGFYTFLADSAASNNLLIHGEEVANRDMVLMGRHIKIWLIHVLEYADGMEAFRFVARFIVRGIANRIGAFFIHIEFAVFDFDARAVGREIVVEHFRLHRAVQGDLVIGFGRRDWVIITNRSVRQRIEIGIDADFWFFRIGEGIVRHLLRGYPSDFADDEIRGRSAIAFRVNGQKRAVTRKSCPSRFHLSRNFIQIQNGVEGLAFAKSRSINHFVRIIESENELGFIDCVFVAVFIFHVAIEDHAGPQAVFIVGVEALGLMDTSKIRLGIAAGHRGGRVGGSAVSTGFHVGVIAKDDEFVRIIRIRQFDEQLVKVHGPLA